MGRKMIKCAASDLVSGSLTSGHPVQSDCYKENGMGVLKSEAELEYLCNLPPHRSHLGIHNLYLWFWYSLDRNKIPISDMKLFIQKTFQR